MIKLPDLPYELDALEPYISKKTIEFHYFKHHKGYVDKLNNLIKGTGFAELSLENIIELSHNHHEFTDIYHNAAQVWNHNFYWQSLTRNGKFTPNEKLLERITHNFGSYENFKHLMHQKALEQFGSGWVWLTEDLNGHLMVYSTSNADNPLTRNQRALITIDVWEHGYYLDYQNLRAQYVSNVLDNLLNWQHANKLF